MAISPEKLAAYKQAARAREARRQQKANERREVAWTVAQQAARILKEKFGATRVIAFGSLTHGAWFHARSDIDLAAEGIAPEAFWRAWCTLDTLGSSFEIDLIALESASEHLRARISQEGVEL